MFNYQTIQLSYFWASMKVFLIYDLIFGLDLRIIGVSVEVSHAAFGIASLWVQIGRFIARESS